MTSLISIGLWVLSSIVWVLIGYSAGRMEVIKMIKKIMRNTDQIFSEIGVNIDPTGKNTQHKTLSPIQTLQGVKLMNDKIAIITGRMQVVDEIFDSIGLNSKKVVKNSVQSPKG